MMQFTKQQIQAITSRSAQTLVSAAAGSGKTRVLTQRIEALVRGADLSAFEHDDGTQVGLGPMHEIRKMLVMTFTRAAAAEMRTRIVRALTDAARVQEKGGSLDAARRLRSEAENAAGADISTIHSFCNRVIGEHYELADVCAGFSILSKEQAEQLMAAAVHEVFEERYERNDPDIVRLLSRFTSKGKDTDLMDRVFALYGHMMSSADWEAWLEMPLAQDWDEGIVHAWDALRVRELEAAAEAFRRAAVLTEKGGLDIGENKVVAKAEKDREWVRKIESYLQTAYAQGPDAAVEMLGTGSFRFANTEKMGGVLSIAQELRKDARDSLELVRSIESGPSARRMLAEAHDDLRLFVQLVRDFTERYAEKKRAINKLDYADLEHKAYSVLKQLRGTDDAYDKRYEHVFVDEYQDTNQVQESILSELTGDNSVFMVGDLKQSIYGFRFADPQIFRSKDLQFSGSVDGRETRIHMNHNFRSTPAVIDTVNAVMRCLMRESFGGVDYAGEEELLLGRTDGVAGHAQILIADASDRAADGEGSAKDTREAEMIAARIAELKAQGRSYGDMAILLRSRSDRVNAIEKALESRGIPYFAELDSNRVFTELDVFLNLLELVVNERRDVPLLSVLRSYMFGFTDDDFARIVNWCDAHPEPVQQGAPDGDAVLQYRAPFFHRLRRYREASGTFADEKDRALAERVESFFSELERLRVMGTDMSLARFAEEVGARFDFGPYLLTRPSGTSRKKAYDTLLETIAAQQEIHGNSLYRVLGAIRKIRQSGGLEAEAAAGDVNAVRITTIHKSKGLEYPVVFVAAMDRAFNRGSVQGDILTSDAYGVTMRHVDEASHIKNDTMESVVVKRYIDESQRSEELRTLYVAMTRARDELYLCGAADDEEKSFLRWEALRGRHSAARSLLDWLMAAYYELRNTGDVPESLYAGSFWKPGMTVGTVFTKEEAPETPAYTKAVALVEEAQKEGRSDYYGLLKRSRQAAVQGVSKLVTAQMRKENGGMRAPYRALALQPVFRESDDGTLSGTQRGTLLHRALRYGVQKRVPTDRIVSSMLKNRLITDDDAVQLEANMYALRAFFDSPLYERVARSPRVLTEQPLELLVEPEDGGAYSGSRMRLRGMIDLAFLDGDRWVLVDYKSDRGLDAAGLAERYEKQIGYYREALEELTGIDVAESYLFSLERGQAVPVGEKVPAAVT